ncbi:MAG: hypothetical protein GF398_02160 [Chitinivibrionales bacterium]|nr:hypothetical protein [Chitinivibrionales bacterium]
MFMRRLTYCMGFVAVLASLSFGQSWVKKFSGAKANDLGDRTDAIIEQEFLSIRSSPLNFGYCHPAMIDETRDGTLIIMFNAGRSEGSGDVYVTRKPKGGQWSDPVMVSGGESIDIGIVYQPRYQNQSTIIVGYYTAGCCTQGGFVTSTDDGVTWSDAYTRSPNWDHDGLYGQRMTFGMNPPIELPNGDVWFASSDINDPEKLGDACITKLPAGKYTTTSEWSSQRIETLSTQHYMGTWLVLSPDYQKLMYIARTNFCGGAYFSTTNDGGQTWDANWTQIENEDVEPQIEFKCGISFVSLDPTNTSSPLNGYHIATGSRHGQIRQGINVAVSTEPLDPNKWHTGITLNFSDIWNQEIKIENADPSIIQSRDGKRLHVLWTGRQQDSLRHAILDPYKLCGVDPTEIKEPAGIAQKQTFSMQALESSDMYSIVGRRLDINSSPLSSKIGGVMIARHRNDKGTVYRRIVR